MTNLTPIYWEASGISLQTHRWAIESFGGNRNAVPNKRGENYQLAFRPGRTRTKKFREQRVLDLAMWCQPFDEDGDAIPGMSAEAAMHQNWTDLMMLFDTEDEFPLVKRWWDEGVVKSATAQAELLDAPAPEMIDATSMRFTVSLTLADPYFYVPVSAQAVGSITVQGNAPTSHVVLTMGNGRITGADGNWIQYNGSGTATVDCFAGTAKVGVSYVNGLLERNPEFPQWMGLYPGVNALTGSGTIAYDAAYK
jgi:hypothetical protein